MYLLLLTNQLKLLWIAVNPTNYLMSDEEFLAGSGSMGSVGNEEGIIAQLIDIREPLVNLRRTLEQRLDGTDLSDYDFWLQDSQSLPAESSLVDHCVQGEGLVQINVEIKVDEDGVKKNQHCGCPETL
ncbi:GABPA [Lepeophtheirus salmonis]|uniref:GABPA n=1 Tax=Lepeophtheirus salmonis TaxID=72036 RepID=A0A7R8CDJ9_LEPSM|nr:GABPA [Lepeophtheirus salmonis]CAF2777625.1 GABPA [Lepeophtheirus salmonis]